MNQTRLLMISALGLGGLFGSVVYRALQAKTDGPRTGVDVVIAAHDIQVGAQIEGRDVKIVKFPVDDLSPDVFHAKNDVVGRGVVLTIAKGEFILPNKLRVAFAQPLNKNQKKHNVPKNSNDPEEYDVPIPSQFPDLRQISTRN